MRLRRSGTREALTNVRQASSMVDAAREPTMVNGNAETTACSRGRYVIS